MNNSNLVPDLERFNSPPPPPTFSGQSRPATDSLAYCIRCNTTRQVAQRSFKRTYVHPVTYLALLFGPLLGLILLAVLRVQHDITLPYCDDCWRGFKRANLFDSLSAFSFLAALIGGVVLMLTLDSGIALLVPIVISIVLIVLAQRNKMRFHPKYKKVNRTQAVVSAGRYGDIIFSKVTQATRAGSS